MFVNALVLYKQLRKVKKFREDRKLQALQKQKQAVQELQQKIENLTQELKKFYQERLRISDNLYDNIMHQIISQRDFVAFKAKIYHLHLQQQKMNLQITDYKNQLTKQEAELTEKRQEYLAAHLETNKFDEVVKITQAAHDATIKYQEEQFLNEFIDEINVINLG